MGAICPVTRWNESLGRRHMVPQSDSLQRSCGMSHRWAEHKYYSVPVRFLVVQNT